MRGGVSLTATSKPHQENAVFSQAAVGEAEKLRPFSHFTLGGYTSVTEPREVIPARPYRERHQKSQPLQGEWHQSTDWHCLVST